MKATPPLVLASTSRYRAELLRRLVDDFGVDAPEVDESAQPGEPPSALASRLAAAKALAVADRHRGALVIGSDQVAELDGTALGKPLGADRARVQLEACSARRVDFHTAVCLVDTRGGDFVVHGGLDTTRVQFRTLSVAEIARYLDRDEPWDCAGSFRVERIGIALFERIDSSDPTALVGLPLLTVCRLLRAAGVPLP